MAVRDNLSGHKRSPMVFTSIEAGAPEGSDGHQVNFGMYIPCEGYKKLTIGSISGGGYYGSRISYTIRGIKSDESIVELESYKTENRTTPTEYDISEYKAVQWHDCRYYGGSYSAALTFHNVVFE